MIIDYEFIIEMLQKYAVHLNGVKASIEKNQESYKHQLTELYRLVQFKPNVYGSRLGEVQDKMKESDLKLSYVVPNIAKINEQVEELKKVREAILAGEL